MNNSTWSNLRRLLKYVRPLMTYLISMAALIAIQAGLTMLDPMYLGRIVDLVLNQQFAMKTLWTLVTIYLAIVISRVLLEIGVNWLDTLFTTKLTFTLRSRILEGILGQDQTFWGHRYTPGDLLTRGTDDVAMVERFMSHSAVDPIAHLVRLALATIVMINLQGRLTLVVVPLLIVIPFVSKVLATKVRGLAKAQREASTRLVQHYSESIQSVDLIQSYNQEKRRLREHEGVLNQYLKQSLRLIVLRMTGPISVELLSLIVTHGAVLSIGGWMVRQGQMTPGGLVAFFTYSMRFQSPMMALLRTNLELQQVMVSAGRILEIIESTDRGNKGDRLLPSRSPTTLELQGVSFTYPERERPAVHGVSLSAKAGRGVAIVGHNGSGKSTLTRLINRFLQPSSGRVLVNGVDTTTVDPSIVRGVIGVVDQQAKVLHASIADNIAFGRPNTSLDEIVRVCEMVHLDRFISTLPASYDTMVGPNGVSLSGGERQKISLARCLICNPQIIIFDEPTTGLDPESERDILALIDDLARTKLVVHITHQLQNLTHFDQIVVMSEGAVVAIGNHDQLLTHPVYRSLWNLDVKSEAV